MAGAAADSLAASADSAGSWMMTQGGVWILTSGPEGAAARMEKASSATAGFRT